MARRGLRGVWVRGELPPGPFVFAANHHSWWDPFLAAVILRSRSTCLIMRQENLARFGLVRRLGVFGTGEHRRGLDYLHEGRVLVIYPEGELRPAGPLGGLADGAAWYARRAGAPLWAVASRVVMRGHQSAEAYLTGQPVGATGPDSAVTRALAECLGEQLSDMDAAIAAGDPRRPLPGFDLAVPGRRSWDERIEAMGRRR